MHILITETQKLRPAFTYILWTPEWKVAVLENHKHRPHFNGYLTEL